ncbi:nucleotide exchange factor GrpE [Alkaliphilus hydrothermalis]|uniref:Protein GrpE n=1 Tax=Alkaliphilus hydrothermalis TaxID=1482730 RepID=A0ABS2NPY4_9FIRM|nr:nucleotide exchange factor GrpE [Alkaliphilus hydrothermalis]MBM7614664.1 molecular chaperone GrpE [Alkaliphilus hydrothermalis]
MEKEIRDEKESQEIEETQETADNNLEATHDVMEETDFSEENSLEEELKKKDAEIQDYFNRLQRLQADFSNFRKRVEKEKSEIYLYANEKIALDLLSIMDNLERALVGAENASPEDGLYQGIQLVTKQLKETLLKHDIEEIDALNQAFDANLHHAVMQEETDAESDTVIEVYQKGYKINNRILRPAMVKVSK